MLTALLVCAALVLLLAAHLIVLPLSKRRPVLLRGPEPAVLTSLVIVCLGLNLGLGLPPVLWITVTVVLLALQAIVGLIWRPWLVFGLSGQQVSDAVSKASGMVRLKTLGSDPEWALHAIGSMKRRGLPGAQLLTFRIRRTKKLVLFQNVLRKCLQNYTLGAVPGS